MASSSTPPARAGEYDVFISHCGADCKRDFADYLKAELENVGIRCFFDEHSLEVGDPAAGKMLDAMETATYGIVILSPGFFKREWCMKELQTFVRRGRIVPIFFGRFEEVQEARRAAIADSVWTGFKEFVRTEEEYVAAADANTERTGLRLAEEGWWSSCIRRVRDEMLRLLGKEKGGIRLSDDDLLVGQHEHLVKLKRLLGVPEEGKAGEATRAASGEVGVKGMGGVGKSTLAKKLYDEPDVREWFSDGLCWLEVGPKPSDDKLRSLQQQILAHTCNSSEDPGNPTRGRVLIRERLHGRRVLICLDDVWEEYETATQVVTPTDLGPGSRILKTSRVKGAVGGVVHDLDALDKESAWELFCWHAFDGEGPSSQVAEAAQRAVKKCGGLPLALRILGRHVACSTDKELCLADFILLPKYSDAMVGCRSIIRRSYDNLPLDPPGLKDVFLLVAGLWLRTPDFSQCQIVVENIGAAVFGEEPVVSRLLLARKALDKLVSRSLLDVELKKEIRRDSYDDRYDAGILPYIRVHDLIVDTAEAITEGGRIASRRFFRSLPGEIDINSADVAWEHVRVQGRMTLESFAQPRSKVNSLVFDSGTVVAEFVARSEGEASPCKLLVIDGGKLSSFGSFTKLLCLRLRGCTFEQVPEGLSSLEQLNILEFDKCKELVALPASLGRLKRLVKLKLHLCKKMVALPISIGQIAGLTQLELRECLSLTALPHSMGQLKALKNLNLLRSLSLLALPEPVTVTELTSLTRLILAGCQSLMALPETLGQLTALTELHLGWCLSLASLPDSLGKLTGLTELHLEDCGSLKALPDSLGLLVGVTMVDISGCCSLAALPEPLGRLTSLTSLNLSSCTSLGALPKSIDQLIGLTKLQLQWCKSLAVLPEFLGRITESKELDLDSCEALTFLPNSVGHLTGLTEMSLTRCKALVVLPDSIGQLVGLRKMDLRWCCSLEALPDSVGLLTALTDLNLEECKLLAALPITVGLLTRVRMLTLGNCNSLAALPDSVGQLMGLTSLELRGCESLTALPESVGQLTGLTQLNLLGCHRLATLPELINGLIGLTQLILWGCTSLTTLPESITRLSGLTQLDLSNCKSLAAVPECTGDLTGLTELSLSGCNLLRDLPKSVGNLTRLTDLDLTGCESVTAMPASMGQLIGLTILRLTGLKLLTELPDSVGCLTNLRSLGLSSCASLATLPNSIGQLTRLWALNLHACASLAALPNSLGQLTGLLYLDLRGCTSLVALPDSLGQLSGLKNLNLEGCQSLTALPNSVLRLEELAGLKVGGWKASAALPISSLVGAHPVGSSVACGHGQVNRSTNESTHMVDNHRVNGVDERESGQTRLAGPQDGADASYLEPDLDGGVLHDSSSNTLH